jgi:hypothetical protein
MNALLSEACAEFLPSSLSLFLYFHSLDWDKLKLFLCRIADAVNAELFSFFFISSKHAQN